MNKTLYVGLDVHKDTIAVAVAEDGRGGEIRFHGTIVNSADAVLRLRKTLTAKGNVLFRPSRRRLRLHGFKQSIFSCRHFPTRRGIFLVIS
ncbi:hypothetical protein FGK63_20255 [Ruegeria sediminis]|uniref:Transposase IS111A/IS1328/IS1533 N-terminal domain-containing protein n=1 Tax=Ruegeria sediminis TaxID=2583820 RepID=A0ABY2WS03_9RHOB|nr:hypothetical protein FGK63_20255 [Ruegeria sediminis]